MRKKLYYLVLLVLISTNINYAQQQIAPTWESINSRPYPEWFKDAKLGIFIHWGLYSVPSYGGKESYGEWYLRGLQMKDSLRTNFMKKNYGENFTYKDFAPLFKAELFDPNEWADLFKKAGAKYIIFVSKHHDGYCLWPSKQAPNWNSVDVGPKRDLVGDLTTAIRKKGLKMGLYYSLPEWNNKLHRWYTDPHENIGEYVDKIMLPQFKDLISTYKPSVLFTDGEWFNTAETWHARELISWYYNTVGDDAIVNNRWGHGSDTGFLTPEYSAGINSPDRPWAECRGIGRSFGLNRNEKLEAYMSPQELIHFFVKAVANGGGITLNVGPKADGQIPLLQQERLLQLGAWIETNKEAIYASRPWIKSGEEKEISKKRIDKNIDFYWARNTPLEPIKEDDFNISWEGFIQSKFSETYTLEATADDGIRVYIDDKLVLDQWKNKDQASDGNVMGNVNKEKAINKIKFKKGKKYKIKIDYFESKQNAFVKLFWQSKSQVKEIIPTTAFTTLHNNVEEKGLTGTYNSMLQHIAYTTNNNNLYAISLEWPNEELVLNIPKPKQETEIQLVGREGNLDWYYKNNQLHIKVDNVKYNEMPSNFAWTFKIKNYLVK
ncbi:alpha-L-fucosidase [uncultured Lutibacter sp.]|uniref:alpha-L-fucosidase n=1 Tax=uncultured Lutibacter sp. TaxID=437739 RepID=UPI00260B3093|nr:alpha-L-fucosidase [uncultured Lutibacter sp.]